MNRDTLVLITVEQTKQVNLTYLKNKELKETNDTLNSIINLQDTLISQEKRLNLNFKKQVDLSVWELNNTNLLIQLKESELNNLNKENKKLKLFNGILEATAIVLTIIIIVK